MPACILCGSPHGTAVDLDTDLSICFECWLEKYTTAVVVPNFEIFQYEEIETPIPE
jgi:hypothetical protein